MWLGQWWCQCISIAVLHLTCLLTILDATCIRMPGISITYNAFSTENALSSDECCRICGNTSDCVAYTFNTLTTGCSLKAETKPIIDHNSSESGIVNKVTTQTSGTTLRISHSPPFSVKIEKTIENDVEDNTVVLIIIVILILAICALLGVMALWYKSSRNKFFEEEFEEVAAAGNGIVLCECEPTEVETRTVGSFGTGSEVGKTADFFTHSKVSLSPLDTKTDNAKTTELPPVING